jgi:hypothetical protein
MKLGFEFAIIAKPALVMSALIPSSWFPCHRLFGPRLVAC